MDNFENLLQSLQQEDSTDAPFELDENATPSSKLNFIRVRAKNFKSIGNEWMELDFTKHKTTLVVSDDNGSGKSTLCVWAPYFALTGKPYNRKEKLGAMVNTSTGKDLLIELYMNTRGVDYKIVRGYKPSVFEIYTKQGGAWVRHETKAGQQQDDLERMLRFDQGTLEKSIILGLDNFKPFVSLSAPERREHVERIWDLGVFSVMATHNKKRRSELSANLTIVSGEIDVLESRKAGAQAGIDQANSLQVNLDEVLQDIKVSEQHLVTQQAQVQPLKLGLQEMFQKYTADKAELEEQLGAAKASVLAEFKAEGETLQAELEDAKAKGEQLKANAEAEFESERVRLQGVLEELGLSQYEEYHDAKTSEASRIQEAEANCAELKAESYKVLQAELNLIDTVHAHDYSANSHLDDYTALTEEFADLEKTTDSNLAQVKQHETTVASIIRQISEINLNMSNAKAKLDAIVARLAEYTEAEERLKESGTCAHCLQTIGEDAIQLYRDSVAGKVGELQAQLDTLTDKYNQHELDMTTLVSELEQQEADLRHWEKQVEEVRTQRADCEARLVRVKEAMQAEQTTMVNQYKQVANTHYTGQVSEAEAELAELKQNSSACLSNLSAKHAEQLRAPEQELETLKSKIEASVAQAQTKAVELASDAQAAFKTWQERTRAAITERTSDITAGIKSLDETYQAENKAKNEVLLGLQRKIEELETDLKGKHARAQSLQANVVGMLETNTTLLKECDEALTEANTKHEELARQLRVTEYLIAELGDNAAKREIIRQYIPYLNNKINEYMMAMNLMVGFKMDEAFNIEFTSPDRKNQTIHSLSNGQRTRMNISILFALRDIANLKNTTATNLLVLDEILEPISEQGIREVVEMLNNKFSDNNIIVISQRKNEFMEYFHNTITYGLRGGFTTMLETE